MLKFHFTSLLALFVFSLFAQEASVEKSLSSLQFNLNTLHFVQEIGLSASSTLRVEAGIASKTRWVIGNNENGERSYFALRPLVSVAGRHYYNLEKRVESGRSIRNNSGNFVTLTAEYRPDLFLFTSNNALVASEQISTKLLWGLRRQLGERFDFEFTAGVRFRVRDFRFPAVRNFHRGIVTNWRFGYRF
ncbi:hypothetical protein [Neolewinella agarilytica]|uniref:hypothetical protein n=1 Tax=Neolewinella agarilytica TaxID=478744 RepID=UPI002354F8D2|nr:hypothetical protein [Neolewinella agarilytica]